MSKDISVHDIFRLAQPLVERYNLDPDDPQFYQKLFLLTAGEYAKHLLPKPVGRPGIPAWKKIYLAADYFDRRHRFPNRTDAELFDEMAGEEFYRQPAMNISRSVIKATITRGKRDPNYYQELWENSVDFLHWVMTEGKQLFEKK